MTEQAPQLPSKFPLQESAQIKNQAELEPFEISELVLFCVIKASSQSQVSFEYTEYYDQKNQEYVFQVHCDPNLRERGKGFVVSRDSFIQATRVLETNGVAVIYLGNIPVVEMRIAPNGNVNIFLYQNKTTFTTPRQEDIRKVTSLRDKSKEPDYLTDNFKNLES